jgi:FixJ family two-component response regulator
MLDVTPMLFVVDDDVSVRESLKSLIRCKGWQPETFASAQEFLDYSRRFIFITERNSGRPGPETGRIR